mmetsp:Transcript_37075/g.72824  ORF Transcript_37075/g.72824 Transcript_37075/m.72824 type:complete len:89 (+) Transcript_37075:1502-1768(+)
MMQWLPSLRWKQTHTRPSTERTGLQSTRSSKTRRHRDTSLGPCYYESTYIGEGTAINTSQCSVYNATCKCIGGSSRSNVLVGVITFVI